MAENINICMLGGSGVGKTWIVKRFIFEKFEA